MAVLDILRYPDPRLHTVARPVAVVDDRIRQLVADMADTMYDAPGIGLAATQVNVHEQVIVIDLSEDRSGLQVFINPEVIASSEETSERDEGCLSVPGIYDTVERPARIRVRALNAQGEPFTLDAEGLLAVCIQHEMDHLKGRVFVQYLSRLKQSRIRTKMVKAEKADKSDRAEKSDRTEASQQAIRSDRETA
jgi:peptide deformylase